MDGEREEWKTRFYGSPAWRKISRAYAESKGYICERCGNVYANPDFKPFMRQFHVHHKVHLTAENVSDPAIALSWDNLELLCQHCHNEEHYGSPCIRDDLYFGADGRIYKKGNGNGEREEAVARETGEGVEKE